MLTILTKLLSYTVIYTYTVRVNPGTMSFLLASFLGGPTNNSDSDSSDENKQLIIEKMTAKMVNSVHLEDRKAAAQTIKSLARSHRLVPELYITAY